MSDSQPSTVVHNHYGPPTEEEVREWFRSHRAHLVASASIGMNIALIRRLREQKRFLKKNVLLAILASQVKTMREQKGVLLFETKLGNFAVKLLED
jgi:phage terminase large subunit GpA-like protein